MDSSKFQKRFRRVVKYRACASYVKRSGERVVEEWEVFAYDHPMATSMAFQYVLQVLKVKGDFEVSVTGA